MTAKERFAELGYKVASESDTFVSFKQVIDSQQTNFVNVDKRNGEFCILGKIEEEAMPVYVEVDVVVALTQLLKELGI